MEAPLRAKSAIYDCLVRFCLKFDRCHNDNVIMPTEIIYSPADRAWPYHEPDVVYMRNAQRACAAVEG